MLILSLALANKTSLHKTGIGGNFLEAFSHRSESQHPLEKCVSYSPPYGDYGHVSDFLVLIVYKTLIKLYRVY